MSGNPKKYSRWKAKKGGSIWIVDCVANVETTERYCPVTVNYHKQYRSEPRAKTLENWYKQFTYVGGGIDE